MNYRYSKQEKQNLINRYLSGESVPAIITETQIPRSTFYSWIKKYNEEKQSKNIRTVNLSNFRVLENKVERLNGMIKILQTATCTTTAPLNEKLPALESLYDCGQYSVRMLCEALNVDRGTFYNHIFRNLKENKSYAKRREELRLKIQEIYDDSKQIFGANKIAAVLKANGERVSAKYVLEIMRYMGIESIRQNSKSRYRKNRRKKKNLLQQNFNTDAPNQVWISDITYFKPGKVGYYICVIIDLFSRKVIGYKTSQNNSTQLVKSTFKQAFESRNPQGQLIFHSDRGTNYTAFALRGVLEPLGVEQSFSEPYTPYDNSVMEAFFKSMKAEELYRTKYRSENDFRKSVDEYIIFFNTKRPHETLNYKTPEQKEADFICNITV